LKKFDHWEATNHALSDQKMKNNINRTQRIDNKNAEKMRVLNENRQIYTNIKQIGGVLQDARKANEDFEMSQKKALWGKIL